MENSPWSATVAAIQGNPMQSSLISLVNERAGEPMIMGLGLQIFSKPERRLPVRVPHLDQRREWQVLGIFARLECAFLICSAIRYRAELGAWKRFHWASQNSPPGVGQAADGPANTCFNSQDPLFGLCFYPRLCMTGRRPLDPSGGSRRSRRSGNSSVLTGSGAPELQLRPLLRRTGKIGTQPRERGGVYDFEGVSFQGPASSWVNFQQGSCIYRSLRGKK